MNKFHTKIFNGDFFPNYVYGMQYVAMLNMHTLANSYKIYIAKYVANHVII